MASKQVFDDLSRLIRRYDRDVNGSWSFREFLTFAAPLTQYSLKAKDLSTALELNAAGAGKQKQGSDKQMLMVETSSTGSLGELNAMLKKSKKKSSAVRIGKENKTDKTTTIGGGAAYSRASRSTAAMSYAGGLESFITKGGNHGGAQLSTIGGGQGGMHGHHSSIGQNYSNSGGMDGDDIYNLREGHSSSAGVLNYPYMCDQVPPANIADQELQFADKIKLINN